jgi:hypothetical protein
VTQIAAWVLLAGRHFVQLAQHGWSEADTADLEAAGRALEIAAGAARAGSARAAEAAMAIDPLARQAAAFKRVLIHALKLMVADGRGSVETPRLLVINANGRSARRLVAWLREVRPSVERNERALAGSLGPDGLARLDKLTDQLGEAYALRNDARSARLSLTRAVRLAAADAMARLDRLHRIAQIAFDGDSGVLKEFKKGTRPFTRRPRKPAAARAPDVELGAAPAANDEPARRSA